MSNDRIHKFSYLFGKLHNYRYFVKRSDYLLSGILHKNYMKMLLKWNLLQYATIISSSGTLVCTLLHCVTNISPITGVFFPLYLVTLFIVSVLFSFKLIQWLLHLNKPINYDLDDIVKYYPHLSFLVRYLPQVKNVSQLRTVAEYKEYDTNELSVISTVLEKKLVSSWYMQHISQEIGFPFACKQMLDQMIGKSFQICHKMETKDIFVDFCTILANHLKEYKKVIKRYETNSETSIEKLYKKSHLISDDSNKVSSTDHCTNLIRLLLKELVTWELWDTPHLELLVRILSKKLDHFIVNTLSDPVWLNDRLLAILEKRTDTLNKKAEDEKEMDTKENFNLDKKEDTSLENPAVTIKTEPAQKCAEELKPSEGKKESDLSKIEVNGSEPVEFKNSPILRQRRGRQGRNEVKIYDRIIEGSVKTWETDIDLQCISLGQDLLEGLDEEITLSRLWGQDAEADGSPYNRDKSPQPLWFGEEDAIDVELADTSPKEVKDRLFIKDHSPKTTELLKELQTTVHQAKTKIGDLQVRELAVVNTADEAAGMMEGLLDFGIAGIKKGLRFTGLSDESQEKSNLPFRDRSAEKLSPSEAIKLKPSEELPASNLKEENGIPIPHLVKQQRVTSQDSMQLQPKSPRVEPSAVPIPLSESPEPQYEEAEDLSTSIAKLRSLLQQRAEAEPDSSEVWWERAEETRGRTQPPRSRCSRPVDTATLADEYDMNAPERNSPGQTSNNMQRLDKLFQRTVTGVFNSIRTAVTTDECETHTYQQWTYVCTSPELSVAGLVQGAMGASRGRVEAALDSLQLAPEPPAPAPAGAHSAPLDDFEEWCSVGARAWSAALGVGARAGLLEAHTASKLAAVLLADLAESVISIWLDELTSWMREQVFVMFRNMTDQQTAEVKELRSFDIDETTAVVCSKVSGLSIFGEETLTAAVKLTISSLSYKEVNKDVIFKLLDVFAMHFKKSASLVNPSFDVN